MRSGGFERCCGPWDRCVHWRRRRSTELVVAWLCGVLWSNPAWVAPLGLMSEAALGAGEAILALARVGWVLYCPHSDESNERDDPRPKMPVYEHTVGRGVEDPGGGKREGGMRRQCGAER